MSLAPLQGMDGKIFKIGFAEALAELQAILGRRVRVYVGVHGTLCGCVIEGQLDRIESLPPDNEAVELMIGQQGVLLDPPDVACLLVVDPAHLLGEIDFSLGSGVSIRVEPVADPARDQRRI